MSEYNETESISNSTNTTTIRKYFMEQFDDPNITECRPTILMTELQVKKMKFFEKELSLKVN